MKFSKTVVPNSRPAYVAEPVADSDKTVEISLEPVVAWQVLYDADGNGDTASAIPVTIHTLPSRYAVYFSDTDEWSVAEDTSNKGLDSLLEYFNQ